MGAGGVGCQLFARIRPEPMPQRTVCWSHRVQNPSDVGHDVPSSVGSRSGSAERRPRPVLFVIPEWAAKKVLSARSTFWHSRWSSTEPLGNERDRKSTRLNSSHVAISYAVFCLKKKKDE